MSRDPREYLLDALRYALIDGTVAGVFDWEPIDDPRDNDETAYRCELHPHVTVVALHETGLQIDNRRFDLGDYGVYWSACGATARRESATFSSDPDLQPGHNGPNPGDQ